MRERLDLVLEKRSLARSRSQARDLIRRGLVLVDGTPETRPARQVDGDNAIVVAGEVAEFVSRGAEKLIAALDAFAFPVAGTVALDIGASTGGFTQVLLTRGVRKVFAVDIGHGQLHPTLMDDPRVAEFMSAQAGWRIVGQIESPVTGGGGNIKTLLGAVRGPASDAGTKQ